MKYNAPQVTLAGSSITTIQGQPGVSDPTSKSSTHADTNPLLQGSYFIATVSAYEADE